MAGLQKENMGWSQVIQKAEQIYQDREHSSLMGISPDDVKENKVVGYFLEAQAGKRPPQPMFRTLRQVTRGTAHADQRPCVGGDEGFVRHVPVFLKVDLH